MNMEKLHDRPISDLAEMFNEMALALKAATVIRFRDRETAIRRVRKIYNEYVIKTGQTELLCESRSAPAPAAVDQLDNLDDIAPAEPDETRSTGFVNIDVADVMAPLETPKANAKRRARQKYEQPRIRIAAQLIRDGKHSGFAGYRITATKPVNPRRLNTFGWRSMEIVYANPGITYEEYIAKGGRNVDLRWDIEHGNATIDK